MILLGAIRRFLQHFIEIKLFLCHISAAEILDLAQHSQASFGDTPLEPALE